MNHPFTPLSEEEIDELGQFLLANYKNGGISYEQAAKKDFAMRLRAQPGGPNRLSV